MSSQSNFIYRPIPWSTVITRMIIGAVIGFLAISLFVFGVDNPNPEWPANWRIRPLIITPIAAAFGAAFSTVLDNLRREGGWKTFAAIMISLVVFLVALWMGTILGLDGTMWD